jgi:hypothetical protein
MKKPLHRTTEIVSMPLSTILTSLLFPPESTAMNDHATPAKPNGRLVHRFRSGNVTACIRRQNTDKGATFHVVFQRSYGEGKKWKTSTVFGRQEVFAVSCVAAQAFQWISARPHAPDV